MPDGTLKLGAVAGAFSTDVRAAAVLSRKAGFGGLQFDARSPSLDITTLSDSGRREFRHVLESQAQQLAGLRHDVGPKGFGPGGDVDRELAQLGRVMEAAKGLGTPLVCVDVGPVPAPAATEPPKPRVTPTMAGLILLPESPSAAPPSTPAPAPDPAFVSQVDAALVELGRLADRIGVVLALRSELSSLAALHRALVAANCPWFGIDLDPAAVAADEWQLDEVFSRFGGHVRHVRARDAVRGADRRTKPAPIGQGVTDWRHLLSNLRDANYRGWITIDSVDLPDRARAAGDAARYVLGL